jgi:hypothetical protein
MAPSPPAPPPGRKGGRLADGEQAWRRARSAVGCRLPSVSCLFAYLAPGKTAGARQSGALATRRAGRRGLTGVSLVRNPRTLSRILAEVDAGTRQDQARCEDLHCAFSLLSRLPS